MEYATVTTAGPPVEVQLDGATETQSAAVLRRGDTWAPSVGQRVLIETLRGSVIVVGWLA